jgi:hypothetical protein
MSTPEQGPLDSQMSRYRAGMPPRDLGEREQFAEWAGLDADDRESAIDERLDPEQEYERYTGPLRWEAWLAERRRSEALERLGIERVELPEPYAEALGPERTERIARQVEDRLVSFADSMPSREALAARARTFGAAARALNTELSRQVATIEERRAGLVDELSEENVHEITSLSQDLAGLAARDDHPDRWLEQHGGPFVDALAAQHHFRRERARDTLEPAAELADVTQELPGAPGSEPLHEPDGAGLDPF